MDLHRELLNDIKKYTTTMEAEKFSVYSIEDTITVTRRYLEYLETILEEHSDNQ